MSLVPKRWEREDAGEDGERARTDAAKQADWWESVAVGGEERRRVLEESRICREKVRLDSSLSSAWGCTAVLEKAEDRSSPNVIG